MSFFEKLGAAVGIGGVKLGLEIPPELHQAEEVTGTVHIMGGNVDQVVQRLMVQLLKFWEETEYYEEYGERKSRTVTASEPVAEVRLDGPGKVAPGDKLSTEFHLPVPPPGCGLTTSSTWWKVQVTAEVPGAVDPTDTVDVTMLPPYEALDMAEAVEKELGWKRSYMGESSDPRGSVQFTFQPPSALGKYYDEVRLHILAEPNGLEIRAVLDLQEKGFMDYLKAAVGKDNKEERYQLAYSDIYDNQDQPLFDPMVDYLRGMIEKYKS